MRTDTGLIMGTPRPNKTLTATTPTPPAPAPTPIGDTLRRQLDGAMGLIPAGKQGHAEVWATRAGVEASVGARLSDRWDVAAWYSRQWDGAQDGGARVRVTW